MKHARIRKVGPRRWAAWLATLALVVGGSAGRGEEPGLLPIPPLPAGPLDEAVQQASCSSCSSGLLGGSSHLAPMLPPVGAGCGEGGCFPGRPNCCPPCTATTAVGRLFCAFHDCLCCPDPCYEPRWVAAANAALFVDPVRPMTQTRLRWDHGRNMVLPDRAEYFWAAIGQRGPGRPETGLNYDELTFYQEAAAERASFFIEMNYRSLEPDQNFGAAGFGDLTLGTKSLLLDCELMQIVFQFKTMIPTGAAGRGLGTGHVSLEPSLLSSIKLQPDTYLQCQLAQWIPLGGTPDFQGGVLHYHFSLNHVLTYCAADSPLIGTLEFNGWSFQSGSFTDPVFGPQSANGYTYLSVGPGLRLVICDKMDIGFGAAFSITNDHFADQLYRTEFRFRF